VPNIPHKAQESHFSYRTGTAKVQFQHYEQDELDLVDHLGVFYEIYLEELLIFINYPILEGKITIKCTLKDLLNLLEQSIMRVAHSLLASQEIPYPPLGPEAHCCFHEQ
jgi:hypothetical protein